jgi:2,5-diamino-6-(ribosylamino)-4(3H)-pyrimidinone 5'-phosphate reductase
MTRSTKRELPFVFVNVAITADGKLAPANRAFIPFGSKRDQQSLLKLRTKADAVIAGARTVDLAPVTMGPGGKRFRQARKKRGLSEYNLRVVVSGAGTLDPNAEMFLHRFSPIVVLTTERISKKNFAALSKVADEVKVFGEKELDFRAALRWLRQCWGVKRLLCEGGGELNDALFRAKVVNELHVTICPCIFGGQNAPTMADGSGLGILANAAQLTLVSQRKIGDELFLVLCVE